MKAIRNLLASASEIETGQVGGLRYVFTELLAGSILLGRKLSSFLGWIALIVIRIRASLDRWVVNADDAIFDPHRDTPALVDFTSHPVSSGNGLRASHFTQVMYQLNREFWISGYMQALTDWRSDLQWKGQPTVRGTAAIVERACLEPGMEDTSLAAVAAQVVAGLIHEHTVVYQHTADQVIATMLGGLLDKLADRGYPELGEPEPRQEFFNYLIDHLDPRIEQLNIEFLERQYFAFLTFPPQPVSQSAME